jgi:T-complex protein 1 subunit zeta
VLIACALPRPAPPQYKNEVAGRAKLGVAAFADALLFIPKTLAANSGLDAQDALIALLEEGMKGHKVGLDVETGKCLLPAECGIWDNHRVKRQFLTLGSIIACKLLLVDEVMRAGRNIKTGPNGE